KSRRPDRSARCELRVVVSERTECYDDQMGDHIAAIRPAVRELFDAHDRGEPGAGDLCATFSVSGNEDAWIQVQLGIVNFAYPRSEEPIAFLRQRKIQTPPGTEVATFKPQKFVTLTFGRCSADDLARFVDGLIASIHNLTPAAYAVDA